MSEKLKVRTHLQVSVSERRKMPKGLNERAYKYRPAYMKKRSWSNSTAENEARRPRFRFNVPEWLLPKNGIDVWATITASIVFGICGRIADMPDYEPKA